MAKVNDVLKFLCGLFPLETACDFDNVGLLVGDGDSEVKNALVALDCTKETLNKAIENNCQLIITHHPVIFEGVKDVLADSLPYNLIKNGISVISMHTNLDIAEKGVSETLCKVLELKNVAPFVADDGYTLWQGETNIKNPQDFALFIKERLGGSVRFVEGEKPINKILVCSGSGGDFVFTAAKYGFSAFVAAEIKHHQLLFAKDFGLSAFDGGHFATEDIIVEPLKELLQKEFNSITFVTFHSNAIKCI